MSAPSLLTGLRPPPGREAPPPFRDGWDLGDGASTPYLAYLDDAAAGWSADL